MIQRLPANASVNPRRHSSGALSPLEVLQFPGVYSSGGGSDQEVLTATQSLFGNAIDSLVANRQREGEQLAALVLDRLQQVAHEVTAIRALMPELMKLQRERIIARIQDLDIEVDSNRPRHSPLAYS